MVCQYRLEDRIKLTPGGTDRVTGVEFLGSIVRLKVDSVLGPLTVVQSDMEFTKASLDLGDQVKASWFKRPVTTRSIEKGKTMTKLIDRRSLLKTAGASAALAGFGLSAPAVHSANEKVVRYLGTATTMGEIDKKLFEDTGIKVKYIPVTTDEVTKRVLTQPNSFEYC